MRKVVNRNRLRECKVTRLYESQDAKTLKDILSCKYEKPIPKVKPRPVAKPNARRERVIKLTRVVKYPSLLKMYSDFILNIFK